MIEHTWDDARLKRDRLGRLQAAMHRQGVGAIYLNDTVDVRYALNSYIPGSAVFLPAEGEPIVFVRSLDEGYVRLSHPDVRPHIYRPDPSDPDAEQKALRWADALAGLMTEYGVAGEPLAIGKCDAVAFLALHQRGFHLIQAQRVLELAKEVKTPDEVFIYWEMGKLYTEIMGFFRDTLQPGMTEEAVNRLVYAKAVEIGAEGLLQINVCSGENMNPWRRLATERVIQDGDLVGLDLHIYGPRGYIFDSARTFLCGSKRTDNVRDLYQRAHAYNHAVIGLLRPGLPIAELRASLPRLPEEFQEAVYSYHIAHSNGLTPGVTWLGAYRARVPGLQLHDKATVLLDDKNEVQPDACLWREEPSGPRLTEKYIEGAPQLVVEIAFSSASYDLHTKMEAYRRNGVLEYLVWRVRDGLLDWFRLREGEYVWIEPEDGIIESAVFPGLRLAVHKLLADDLAGVLAHLDLP